MAYAVTMVRNNKPRSGVTLGGIGTGGFEIRQDGVFYNWSLFNNAPLNTGPRFDMANDSILFFVVRYQEQGKEPRMKVLQIEPEYGAAGIIDHPHYYVFPWLSGVDRVDFSAIFPIIHMRFTDRDMPFTVEMEALSPFVPHDIKHSSLPSAIFNFRIVSKTSKPVDVMLMASMRNAVCYDNRDRLYVSGEKHGPGYKGFELTADGVDTTASSFGTMGVASLAADSTWYLGWEHRHPYYETVLRSTKLPNMNDTAGRHHTDRETGKRRALERCFATVAKSKRLGGRGAAFDHTFVASWCFPNRYAETRGRRGASDQQPYVEGHYWSNFFSSASQVNGYLARNLKKIAGATRAFHASFYDSSAPHWLLDQVNSNLNTLITSTWLTKQGNFGVIEGIDAYQTFAGLDTTDVAMYGGIASALLFPELNKNSLKAFNRFQGENGIIAHSIPRNFRTGPHVGATSNRVDMPCQFAFMSLRAYLWSGDRAFLDEVWPGVKKALDYVLRERDKNQDGLPDMEGIMCSYDNFPMYGVSSYVGGQFLAAVATAVRVAAMIGDSDAAQRYAAVLEKGRAAFEQRLWNGSYYRLYNDEGGQRGDKDEGCMADQLIAQWAGHQVGGGHLFDKARVKKALQSVMAMNFHPDYGLRNCRWPGDRFLHAVDKDCWVDQANTAWTGVELAFACLLLYEGMYREAMTVVKNVDDRHRAWGIYWDHKEFGGHYFRPLSALGIPMALLGMSVADGAYRFAPAAPGKKLRLFMPLNNGWGHYNRLSTGKSETVTLEVESGALEPKSLECVLVNKGAREVTVMVGKKKLGPATCAASITGGTVRIVFAKPVRVTRGGRLTVVARS